jgi:hypothetical protein
MKMIYMYKGWTQQTTMHREVTEEDIERIAYALYPQLKRRKIQIEEEENEREGARGGEPTRRYVVTTRGEADIRGMEIMVGVENGPTRQVPADLRWTARDLIAQTREWVGVPREWEATLRVADEKGEVQPFRMQQGWTYRIERKEQGSGETVTAVLQGVKDGHQGDGGAAERTSEGENAIREGPMENDSGNRVERSGDDQDADGPLPPGSAATPEPGNLRRGRQTQGRI